MCVFDDNPEPEAVQSLPALHRLTTRGRHFSNPQNTYVSWRLLSNPSNSQDTSGTFGPQDQNLVIVGKYIC